MLSGRVAELSTALGRAGMRLESVEAINRQLGEFISNLILLNFTHLFRWPLDLFLFVLISP